MGGGRREELNDVAGTGTGLGEEISLNLLMFPKIFLGCLRLF